MGEVAASLFISHRHKDKAIADVFREAFEDWSNNTVSVFQSSSAQDAPRPGARLDEAVGRAIADSQVVLLIYTIGDDDWNWCMYECGLAQDPEKMETRTVVFHTGEPPRPLQHLVTVPFAEDALLTLADDFHRDIEFFPRLGRAIAPGLDERKIEERSRELFERLRPLLSGDTVVVKEQSRYDSLVLEVDTALVETVRTTEREAGYREALRISIDLLKERCAVRRGNGAPQVHFGFEEIPAGLLFSDLVARWRSDTASPDLAWDLDLYTEMARTMMNRPESALSIPFRSVLSAGEYWLLAVLERARTIPRERRIEFDVLLCCVEPKAAEAMTQTHPGNGN